MSEVEAGRAWQGTNRRVNPNDLAPEQSPDASNCRNYQNQLGLLGPRPGRTFVNARGYEGKLMNIVPYNGAKGTFKYILPMDNGNVYVVDAPQTGSDAPPSTYSLIDNFFTTKASSGTTLTVTYPTATGTANGTLDSGTTYDTASAYVAGIDVGDTLSATDATGNGSWVSTIGVVASGVSYPMARYRVTVNASFSGTNDTWRVQLVIRPFAVPVNGIGTLTGLYRTADITWPAGTSAGTFDTGTNEGVR